MRKNFLKSVFLLVALIMPLLLVLVPKSSRTVQATTITEVERGSVLDLAPSSRNSKVVEAYENGDTVDTFYTVDGTYLGIFIPDNYNISYDDSYTVSLDIEVTRLQTSNQLDNFVGSILTIEVGTDGYQGHFVVYADIYPADYGVYLVEVVDSGYYTINSITGLYTFGEYTYLYDSDNNLIPVVDLSASPPQPEPTTTEAPLYQPPPPPQPEPTTTEVPNFGEIETTLPVTTESTLDYPTLGENPSPTQEELTEPSTEEITTTVEETTEIPTEEVTESSTEPTIDIDLDNFSTESILSVTSESAPVEDDEETSFSLPISFNFNGQQDISSQIKYNLRFIRVDIPETFIEVTPAIEISWDSSESASMVSIPVDDLESHYIVVSYINGIFRYIDASLVNGNIKFLVNSGDIIQLFKVDPSSEEIIPNYISFSYLQYSIKKSNSLLPEYVGVIPNPLLVQTSNNLINSSFALTGSNFTNRLVPTKSLNSPKYDKRAEDYFPKIKNQLSAHLCWDFSAIGAVEIYLGQETGVRHTLSESNAAHHLSSIVSYGYNRNVTDGGNFSMHMSYLTRFIGPVQEDDDPYENVFKPNLIKNIDSIALVTGHETISYDVAKIKNYVMQYGSVVGIIYVDDFRYTSSSRIYNKETSAHYSPSFQEPNHYIVIVGWDDSFSKSNFSVEPPIDGAWIVKNSHGTNTGDEGYLYLSYADAVISTEISAVTKIDNIDKFDNLYCYDTYGGNSTVSFPTSTSSWFANKFTRKSDSEILTAVSFYSSNGRINYEIWFSPTDKFEDRIKLQAGSLTESGYFTIDLDSPIELDNSEFTIFVKFISVSDAPPQIPLQKNIVNYIDNSVSAPNRGFVSSNGDKWRDVYEMGNDRNVCVRAFTVIPE